MYEERFIATGLKNLLREEGRQQSWLARRLGISQAHTHRIVHGQKTINRQRAEEISTLLGAPLSVLFDLHRRTESTTIMNSSGDEPVRAEEQDGKQADAA
jgi:plasmid maintenance system antidote protein VapI